jgi:hypothetical protein
MRHPIPIITLAAALLALLPPPSASAGTYEVTACSGAENASWTPWKAGPGVVAYASCPGGVDASRGVAGEGLYVRNVLGRGMAAPGAAAGFRFDAPAGTTITGIAFDGRLLRNPGWQAGLQDAADRWLWCGDRCSTSANQWVHDEVRGLATTRLSSIVRCVSAHCRRDRLQAFVALRNLRVSLSDPTAPTLGALTGAGDGWLRGRLALAAAAGDATGIRGERVEVDGRAVHAAARPCDFTRPVPCTGGALRAVLDTRGLADGVHRLRAGVADAGGNWAWRERVLRVDNTAPPEPVVGLDGGSGWSPVARRVARAVLPPAGGAPVARAVLSVCRAGGGACRRELAAVGAGGRIAVPPLPAVGEYAVRVALEDAAGNTGPASPPLVLRFDDTVPGAPDLRAADGWLRGDTPLRLAVSGAAPPSGIAGFRVGDRTVTGPLPLAGFPEGATPIEVRTVSGAAVASTAVRTSLRIDRSAPSVSASGLPAGDAWSTAPVAVALRGGDNRSGVARIAWRVGDAAEVSAPGADATVRLDADGRHVVRYRAIDAAGNPSPPASFSVRIDRTPPGTVAFEAQDPADPARVRAVVADATSGVVSGTIDLRPADGTWQPLATTLAGGRLTARIDDAALRAGPYELRARAVDAAGNAAVGTARADGSPAAVVLPLRRPVTLTISRSGRLVTASLREGAAPLAGLSLLFEQRLRGRSAWRRICGRRTVVIAAVPEASPSGCAIRTGADGRARLRLRPGPSRTVRARFAGDARLLPARDGLRVRTRARVRLRAVPAVVPAGGVVRFRGSVRGGPVPRGGKLVDVQARVGGGWRTFATVRTGRRGRLRHRHRFAPSSSGRTYWFRVLARKETAYPYESAASPAVAVRVL